MGGLHLKGAHSLSALGLAALFLVACGGADQVQPVDLHGSAADGDANAPAGEMWVDDGGDLGDGFEHEDEGDRPIDTMPGEEVPILCGGGASNFTLLALGNDASELSIAPSVSIDGNIGAKYWLTSGPLTDVSGDITFPVSDGVVGDALALAAEAADLTVNEWLPALSAETYALDSGVTVYGVEEVTVATGGTLTIDGPLDSKLIVLVHGAFEFGESSTLALDGGIEADNVLFVLNGTTPEGHEDRIGGGSTFQGATILAPQRTLFLGGEESAPTNHVAFTGAVMAETVKVAPCSTISGAPFGSCPF